MVKNKKFMVIFAVFILSAALLTGCSTFTEGEIGQEEPGISDSGAPTDNEQATTGNQADEVQATANANGVLKSFDADTGLITLVTQSGDNLELKVTGESKILISTSPAALDQLATIIGSEVSVDYHDETKTVTAISIKN
ncbi:MAG: hypothetical protein APF77_02355 [Clostridia bacterium BRH_c25]|nr:MAG: hypothetical protein APF77_02355 [Clostridia bacterium BRH_c25]